MKRKIPILLLIFVFFFSSMSFAQISENGQGPLGIAATHETDEEAYEYQLRKIRRMISMIEDEELREDYAAQVDEVEASDETYTEKMETLQMMEEEILPLILGDQNGGRSQALMRITERSIMLEDNFGLQRARQVLERLEQRKERLEEQKFLKKEEKRQLRERKLEDRLFIRGENLSYDVPPVIREGRTLIPVRAITEGLGAEVTYDQPTKTITIEKDDTTIIMVLGSDEVTVNGETRTIDVPSQLNNNRTFVPLRFISEILGDSVDYNAETGDIDIALDDAEALALIDDDDDDDDTDDDDE